VCTLKSFICLEIFWLHKYSKSYNVILFIRSTVSYIVCSRRYLVTGSNRSSLLWGTRHTRRTTEVQWISVGHDKRTHDIYWTYDTVRGEKGRSNLVTCIRVDIKPGHFEPLLTAGLDFFFHFILNVHICHFAVMFQHNFDSDIK